MNDAVLHGSLDAFSLPDVLTFLSSTRKSGTLTVMRSEVAAFLFFEAGALVFAGSNQEAFRLGAILLRKKRITREQRDRIDALMTREGGHFGAIAVQHGLLTEQQLTESLKVQVSEIVYDCFVWDGGTFEFREETSLPPHAVTIAVDLPNLIMEGARRIEEWEQCLRLLPDRRAVFRVVVTPRDEKITLTSEEWKILFLINGVRTLEELCEAAEDDSFQVYRVVYGLLANKLIEPLSNVNEPSGDDTNRDATVRQTAPVFSAEATMRSDEDDTSLLVSAEAKLSYADVVRPTVARLTVDSDDEAGRVVPLIESEYLLGRHRDNGVQISDLGVSGFHARIYRGAEGYIIEDLKSRNGTWVNGARVFHHALMHGDRVHVGSTDLLYEVLFED